jgi:hypothetical protein
MNPTIYQIRIALDRSNPEIWRRVLVPAEISLAGFHLVIQSAMGWENEHLHQFIKNKRFYTIRYPGDGFWNEMTNMDYEKEKLRICDLLLKVKNKISYEYDFGDSWIHTIVLEKIIPAETGVKYPVCIAGKMNCPPEDSGGIFGYMQMLDILKHPENEQYEDFLEWIGEDFDPEEFDMMAINKMLLRLKIKGV